ncbi:unnamed protein product [Mortierella alpina]
MTNKFCKRSAAPITHNEYCVLVNVHRHLSDPGPLQSNLRNATPLKRLATAAGVDMSTAREAIRLCNNRENPPERPRRDIQTAHEIVIAIRKVFLDAHNDDDALHLISVEHLLQGLANKHNIFLHERTLLRYLRRLKCHAGRSVLQTAIFESQTVIDYRNLYVERRINNIGRYGLPVQPEVYVDESYWTFNQFLRPMRVSQGLGLNERGQEPILVVFAAMVVSSVQSKVSSKLVRKSVLIWPKRGIGQDLPGSITTNEQLWRSIPNTVQRASIATDFEDIHCYYTDLEDPIWEAMFDRLCKTLAQDYGSCQIHMDGADPHMRRENMLPYAPKKSEDVHQWFVENRLPIPTGPRGERLSRAELVVRAREARVPPRYASDTIASKHSHTVLRIPQHHYEFQPLEKVWKMAHTSTTAISGSAEPVLKLRNRLLEVFAGLTGAQLTQYWVDTHTRAVDFFSPYSHLNEIGQVSQGETDNS